LTFQGHVTSSSSDVRQYGRLS